MSNLATNLAGNLATNLATNLAAGAGAAGTWRDSYPTLEDYWPTINTTGDVLVSGNLDQWVGRIAGWILAAPSAVQRPTNPGGLGWRFNRPDSQFLESTDAGLLALLSGSTPWSSVIRFDVETLSLNQYLCSQFASATDNIGQQLGAGNNYNLRRDTSGGTTNVSPVGPISGKHTLGFSFDGSFTYGHLDGSPSGTPQATSGPIAALISDVLGGRSAGVGSAFDNFDAIIYERLVFSSALSDADMLAIHNSLVTDYP